MVETRKATWMVWVEEAGWPVQSGPGAGPPGGGQCDLPSSDLRMLAVGGMEVKGE